ncbi:oligosaccharide flippase family protein [Vibrio parahaemolyticus]|nr:oligosaccharide flippase family protein [Vibrio parahaemolyticus]
MLLNRSFVMLTLQVISILLGLFTTYYIAKTVEPEQFSIFAIYNMIFTVVATFSFIGFETELSRNALKWIKESSSELSEYTSMIFSYRSISWLILFIPNFIYVYFVSQSSYAGHYLEYFVVFIFSSYFYSLTNGIVLILRGMDKYIVAMLIALFSNVLVKFIAISIYFFNKSFDVYIMILSLFPILTTVIGVIYLRSFLNIKIRFDAKACIKKVKKVYRLGLSGYLSYFKHNLDQILMPLILSAELLGTYALCKNIELVAKQAIENIFDPLTQRFVLIKDNVREIHQYLNKLLRVNRFIFILSLLFSIVIMLFINDILSLIEISNYPYIETLLGLSIFSQLVYLFVKVKYNYIYLMFRQEEILKMDVVNSLMIIISMIVSILIATSSVVNGAILLKVLLPLTMIISTLLFFKRHYNLENKNSLL